MKRTMKGFGVVEGLLIVAVIGLIGAVGYIAYDKMSNKTGNSDTTAVEMNGRGDDTKVDESAQSSYTLNDAIVEINQTLAKESCDSGGSGNGAQVSKESFLQVNDTDLFDDRYENGKSLINKDLTYALTQYGCGTSGSVSLLKKVDDGWVLVSEDARMYPMCDAVRGQGFPKSLVDRCYENDTAAEPVRL